MLLRLWIFILQALGFNPRGLFIFWDGRRYRRVDPMVIARNLWAAQVAKEVSPGKFEPMPFESLESLKLVKSAVGTKIQQGYAEIAEAVREAFELRHFENGGLSENECQLLLARFEDYLGDVKKNGSNSPTGSDSTNASPDGSATNSNSDSGSTSTDSVYVMPDVSELELQSQMAP